MPLPPLRGAEVELLRLVRQGCLVRETDPADRRAARLLPTPAAEARLGAWRRRRAALVRRQLALLDETDRAALYAALPALRKLAVTLREEADQP